VVAVAASPRGEAQGAVDLAAFVAELPGTWQGGGYRARCPAHHDVQPSLSINQARDGGLVLHCHAGCETKDVLAAMGKSFADLNPAPRAVAEYHYTDVSGTRLLWTVVRYEPKDFRCRPGLPPAEQRVLYQAPAIAYAARSGTPVFVVEGERDVESLLALNVPATCNVGGAGKWLSHYSQQLSGCHVRIVADNDEPGRKHALQVAEALVGHAASVEVLRPAAGCKDITDHLRAGHSLDDLLPLEPPPSLTGVMASDVQVTKVTWAWHPYFPTGSLCFIDGDPGDGKSVLTIDLVSRWTAGMAMPDGQSSPFGEPVTAIMIGAEDDVAATIVPRIKAHGGRCDRIKLITAGRTEADVFNITSDLDALEAEIIALGARIVVIDPLPAFLHGSTDSNSDASVRRALGPLAAMARRLHVLILLVRHLNKGTSKALYRGGGSIGFIGAARAAFLVSRNPDDETQRVLAPLKTNLAATVPTLAYRLATDSTYEVPRVEWSGALTANAQELLDGPDHAKDGRADVQDFLRHICAGEALKWTDITKYGRDAGFSAKALETHRGKVLVKQFLPGEGNRGVAWGLRDGVPAPAPPLHLVPEPTEEPEETTEETKDRLLSEMPPVCEVCHDPTAPVMRFGRPHWSVRCRAHNPLTYRG
jgi:putative DNA primase/helicase